MKIIEKIRKYLYSKIEDGTFIIVIAIIFALVMVYDESWLLFSTINETNNNIVLEKQEEIKGEINKTDTPSALEIKNISNDEYKNYILKSKVICPFKSTAETSNCLDKELKKQDYIYNNLSQELLSMVKRLKSEGYDNELEFLGVSRLIPEYSNKRKDIINLICSVKYVTTTGTAIISESRRCAMYYNSKDIEMIKDIISDY